MKKTTVTIGIPAYNEERNIEILLRSIIDQKLHNVIIKEILVYSDASTDNTNLVVNNLKKICPLLKLKMGKSRRGKYFRVNELFRQNTSDILIVLDADIALVGNRFIENFVKEANANPYASMVVAHNILIRPKGLVAELLYSHLLLWDFIRLSIPNYDSVENYFGTATAYRRNFARSIVIPATVTDPHMYIYLVAKKRGGFRYSFAVEVLQNSLTTFQDMKKLIHRSIGKKDRVLENLFGEEMIYHAQHVSIQTKIIGTLKYIIHYPLYTPFAVLLSFYLGRLAQKEKTSVSPIWEINLSTKIPIPYAK
ncbi:MAG TPA: glycosyltransferase family A protein [Candidatus Sulfotelmatobacter sp.]|jgi:glycosyltransferase involved in cell wall biosynthesis|nr:glycosyltransferase family A protein [Candidatus Sulfotelmatobacter sp.]